MEKGNNVRYRNAAIRREIFSLDTTASRVAAADAFRNPTNDHLAMRASYLLGSVRCFGAVRKGKLIRKCGLAPGRLEQRLCELSERERQLIADHLENPDLPAAKIHEPFTRDELHLIRKMSEAFAERTFHAGQAIRLERIAQKCERVA